MKKVYFMLLCAACVALVGCKKGGEETNAPVMPIVLHTTIDSYCGTFNFSATNNDNYPITGTVIITKIDSANVSIDMKQVNSTFSSPVHATYDSVTCALTIAPQQLDSVNASPRKYDVLFRTMKADKTLSDASNLILKEYKSGKIAIASTSPTIGCGLYSNVMAEFMFSGDGTLTRIVGFNLEKSTVTFN